MRLSSMLALMMTMPQDDGFDQLVIDDPEPPTDDSEPTDLDALKEAVDEAEDEATRARILELLKDPSKDPQDPVQAARIQAAADKRARKAAKLARTKPLESPIK